MSLSEKYRPKTIEEFISSKATKSSIVKYLEKEDKQHSIVITGKSGCGKTTLARIIAKNVGCTKENFIEINASDYRGIDTVRDIKESISYSSFKCFLFDECHQLTVQAQEALLKYIEDQKEHIYFIFCTTEPEKLKITFQRRCFHFKLELANAEQIVSHLESICKKENQEIDRVFLESLAEISENSFGVAVKKLEEALTLSPELRSGILEKLKDTENKAIDLCRAINKGEDWKKVANILEDLKDEEPEYIKRCITSYLSKVLLSKGDIRTWKILKIFDTSFFYSGFPMLVKCCYEACNI
jgi:DNA polymerase-3 subunit gamma/tau